MQLHVKLTAGTDGANMTPGASDGIPNTSDVKIVHNVPCSDDMSMVPGTSERVNAVPSTSDSVNMSQNTSVVGRRKRKLIKVSYTLLYFIAV